MHRTTQALVAVWAVITAFIGYLVFGLINANIEIKQRTRAHAVSYVRLVEQHAASAFERADLTLLGVKDHVLADDIRVGSRLTEKRRKEIEALLLAHQQRTSGVVAMPLANANGDVIAHSLGTPAGMTVADRKHFQTLKQHPETQVAISEAVLGRVTKRWGVTIGRRIDLPDGRFGGMIGAQLDLQDIFIDFYATLPLGRNAAVSLRDPENRLLVRYPMIEEKLGQEIATAGEVSERLHAGDAEDVLITPSAMDGVERVFAFRRLQNSPVYAAVGLSLDEVLNPWRQQRNTAAVASLLLIGAGIFITIVLLRNQRAQRLLRQSEIQLSEAQRIANLGSWEWTQVTDTISWSEELCRIFEFDRKMAPRNYQQLLRLYSAESQSRLVAAVEATLANGTAHELELEHVRPDGDSMWVVVRGEATRDARGRIVGLHGTAQDITQRKFAELALARESARNQLLLRTASDGIHVLDADGNIIEVSDAFCHMLRYARDELLGQNVRQWDVGSHPEGLSEKLARLQADRTRPMTFETRYRRGDGVVIDVEICSIGVEFDGEPMLFASARDVTERNRAQQTIQHQALYDSLTGVPNRILFYDRLNQAITLARRGRYEVAVLFIDLDKFKAVNDSFGHMAGDEVLKLTATRIRQSLRESDTVARVGGDEFTVILPHIANRDDVAEVAEKIINAVSAPCEVRDGHDVRHTVAVGVSIGIAIYPAHADDADRLVEAADGVMYIAKKIGNTFCFCGSTQCGKPAQGRGTDTR